MPDRSTTETHRRMLDEQIGRLREGDADLVFCITTYEHYQADFKTVGRPLIDELIVNAARLYDLLKTRGPELTDRQRAVALAALLYFIHDHDHIPDDYGYVGLVDDALIVRAACDELTDVLK